MTTYDWDFNFANIGQFYELFLRHGSHNAVEQCLEYCDENAKRLLDDENGFAELPYSLVLTLMCRRTFSAREVDFAKALIFWHRKHNDFELNELLKLIRWNLISNNDFCQKIRCLGVITDEQYYKLTSRKCLLKRLDGKRISKFPNGNKIEKSIVSGSLLGDEKATLRNWVFDQTSEQYVCQVCRTEFMRKQNVQRHMYIHLDANFKCSFCDKKYKTRELLRDHEKGHQVNFTCSYCGKSDFSLMSSITRHHRESCAKISPSTGQVKFKSTLLFRSISSKPPSATKRIVDKYIRQKRPTINHCKPCDKKYNTPQELRDHLRAHEVNFTCDSCGRRGFTLFSSIRKHKMSICEKTFYKQSEISKK